MLKYTQIYGSFNECQVIGCEMKSNENPFRRMNTLLISLPHCLYTHLKIHTLCICPIPLDSLSCQISAHAHSGQSLTLVNSFQTLKSSLKIIYFFTFFTLAAIFSSFSLFFLSLVVMRLLSYFHAFYLKFVWLFL